MQWYALASPPAAENERAEAPKTTQYDWILGRRPAGEALESLHIYTETPPPSLSIYQLARLIRGEQESV